MIRYSLSKLGRAGSLSVLALGSLLGACGEAGAGPGATAVRDSAGIRIVENRAPAWEEGEAWRLSEAPLLEIGMAEGPAAYLLDEVRGALRLDDGRIVVANAGSGELRFYAADGAHLQSVGREGDGPGEYQAISWLSEYRGDSLMVFDFQARRASILGPDGSYQRGITFVSSGDEGIPSPQAAFGDGTMLGRKSAIFRAGEVTTGMRKADAVYIRYSDVDGGVMDSLTTLPDQERHVVAEADFMMVTSPLLAPRVYHAVAGDSVFLGHSATLNLGVYGQDGTLRRFIRRSGEPVPVTPDDIAALLEEQLGSIEDDGIKQRMTRVHEAMPKPDVRPAFSALAVDDPGNLWVRETVLPGEPNSWTVFDADGRLLGPVQLIDDIRVMHIGDDFLLGVVTDELGVERVRMYGIEKG